jgi:DNA polymerase V
MIAIVDCNSFYCSCERLFKPHLHNKPVVVLSNNDGCIIARSDEAKAIGVDMAGPYFKAKPLIEQHGVAVFSSNYNLYGDLSWRVMETLRQMLGADRVEVYSVDEAFLDLAHIAPNDLQRIATEIKDTVEEWTGIKVSIGVAPTKVLSKVANRLAKKNKQVTQCVLVLNSANRIQQALQKTAVEDVWGVGRQYAYKLQQKNILTAYDLSLQPIEWAKKNLGGVVGERLLRELKGETAKLMEEQLVEKKMIATTRMFGTAVKDIASIKEAVATYASRAAEKLRRQHSVASYIEVFMVPKEAPQANGRFRHGPTIKAYTHLPIATAITSEFIKAALQLVDGLYEEGRVYKKAGVLLSGIVPEDSIQANLFVKDASHAQKRLMQVLDNINFSQRNDIIKFAASGTTRNWKMQQNFHSPRYTTRWDEICAVH